MSNKCKVLLLAALLMVGFWQPATAGVNVSVSVGNNDFGFLGSYGNWVRVPRYGAVWRPSVAAGWRPFTYGHWRWTDQGWMWVSYEPYGWAVYHYGNWHFEPGYGWVWIPGYDWSPARVRWTYYGSYVGWAPLPPSGVVLPEPWAPARVHYWNMITLGNLPNENVARFVVRTGVPRPAARVRIVQTAPAAIDVERVTRRKINVVRVNTVDVPQGKVKLRRIQLPADDERMVAVHGKEVERDVTVKQKVKVSKNEKGEVKVKKKTTVHVKKKNNSKNH